jgi:hypothetical protein
MAFLVKYQSLPSIIGEVVGGFSRWVIGGIYLRILNSVFAEVLWEALPVKTLRLSCAKTVARVHGGVVTIMLKLQLNSFVRSIWGRVQ